MVIACAGYRVASTPGHHRLHFEAARIALGSSADRFLGYFETSRRKRNGKLAHHWVERSAYELSQQLK